MSVSRALSLKTTGSLCPLGGAPKCRPAALGCLGGLPVPPASAGGGAQLCSPGGPRSGDWPHLFLLPVSLQGAGRAVPPSGRRRCSSEIR